MALKVTHERWKCIACAACAAVDPDNWKMNEEDSFADLVGSDHSETPEGRLESKNVESPSDEEKKSFKEAEQVCPVECIHVEDL